MKVFITISTLLAVVSADQSSHQTIQHGHSAPSHTSLHKPHGSHRHAVHVPVHQSPPYHSSPILQKPAPYHSVPIVHQPTPYQPAPAHKSPYHAESYDTPAVYQYGYAVADDYAGTNFAQNENRDGYSTAGISNFSPFVVKVYMYPTRRGGTTTERSRRGVAAFKSLTRTNKRRNNTKMKVFITISTLLAVVSADQSSHQTIQHGHSAPSHTSLHKPHGSHRHAVHVPVHQSPPYHSSPILQKPAPYHSVPIVHQPTPYHPAPTHNLTRTNKRRNNTKMKVFITISTLLAVVSADQSSHQTIQHGHSAPSHTSLHKPHGSHRHAVHVPVHQSPPYHSSPILQKPAPYHSVPIVHQPTPYHPAPTHNLTRTNKRRRNNTKMKVFITISTLLAVVSADQSSHQTIQHGHSAPSHTSLHKPHGSHRHAVHVPVHQSPPYHSSPILQKPAPYHSVPIVHQPTPLHPAPTHNLTRTNKRRNNTKMKVFITISTLLAVVSADQSSHQTIQHGHSAPSHTPSTNLMVLIVTLFMFQSTNHPPYHSSPILQKPAPTIQFLLQFQHFWQLCLLTNLAIKPSNMAILLPLTPPSHKPHGSHRHAVHVPVHQSPPYHSSPILQKPAPYHSAPIELDSTYRVRRIIVYIYFVKMTKQGSHMMDLMHQEKVNRMTIWVYGKGILRWKGKLFFEDSYKTQPKNSHPKSSGSNTIGALGSLMAIEKMQKEALEKSMELDEMVEEQMKEHEEKKDINESKLSSNPPQNQQKQ
ncbi:unnamed protein product [Lepeophtheirus salmonis]|uniref:(salmon louse) hypothetical protein n=1 Tax=Lepeophtheirus salmonis TaxID=72036 RepID=A0A7R8CMB3_LEPSM|nr:unnamed protein product [Lepeophtheirus salmonis]CAF2861288.1 unnamed protein product [Lepeophtheirus salmonis]